MQVRRNSTYATGNRISASNSALQREERQISTFLSSRPALWPRRVMKSTASDAIFLAEAIGVMAKALSQAIPSEKVRLPRYILDGVEVPAVSHAELRGRSRQFLSEGSIPCGSDATLRTMLLPIAASTSSVRHLTWARRERLWPGHYHALHQSRLASRTRRRGSSPHLIGSYFIGY
jgi:hypothetical protein